MAHQENHPNAHHRRGLVLALVSTGALLAGLQSAIRLVVEFRQQLEMTIPVWIPRLILENAVMAISRMLS